MKKTLFPAAARFITITLAFIPVLPVMRIIEYLLLRNTPDFPGHAFQTELLGMIHDLFAFMVLAFLIFIPFFLLFILSGKAAEIAWITLIGLLTILQISLIKYFSVTLEPLDEVLFSFSFKEVMLIIRSSDELNFMSFFPMIIPVILFIILYLLFRKILPGRKMIFFMAGFGTAAVIVSAVRPSVSAKDETDFIHYLKVNKSSYFIKNSISSLFTSHSWEDTGQVDQTIMKYHDLHPEFKFTGKNYPLLHKENTPDVLGPFFKLANQPPNLVFIIVESLSSACIGDSSWFGNFTPYLDSLKNHSLYWDNFLSTSERTFHVLQALFASVPYGRAEFQKDMSMIPNHYSLLSLLKKNGYSSSFFYGGDATFTGYDQFLGKQGLDFLLTYFGKKYDDTQLEYKDFRWGYQDEALFERSLEALDSLKREPRIDIYLTLSMHFPFKPPRSEYYLSKVSGIMDRPGYPAYQKVRSEKFRELFSSVLYTDDAIRSFMKKYALRKDFQNTIFFITGDHAFTEFGNTTISAIEHYHVPMIIYSPLLRESRQFHSVSSHLDITPSIFALLKGVYDFHLQDYSHWLGQGLDTAIRFRNIHTLAFTGKNNKTEEYLKNEYYFSKGFLHRIGEGMKTISVHDDDKKKEMKEDLDITVTVFNYTNQNNLFLPPSLYLPIRLEQEVISSFDAGNLQLTTPGKQFLDLMPVTELNSDYVKLHFDIRFSFMIMSFADTGSVPMLTASVEDKKFRSSLYHVFDIPKADARPFEPNKWYSGTLYQSLDLSHIDSLKGKFLKLYFYYQDPCNIQFDSITVTIRGTK